MTMLGVLREARIPLLRHLVPPTRPAAPTPRAETAVLRTVDEWRAAAGEARRLGLARHPDPPKTWDSLIALDVILRHTHADDGVLDAGAERYSVLLPWLARFGYRDLCGINLVFDRVTRRGPIRYLPGDLTRTGLPDASLGAMSCLSVIEHGVDVDAYLAEAARLLRPGGVLVTSLDYWPDPVDTAGKQAYGTPIRILTRADVHALVAAGARHGLAPTMPITDATLAAQDRAVRWRRHDLAYTFAIVTLRRA